MAESTSNTSMDVNVPVQAPIAPVPAGPSPSYSVPPEHYNLSGPGTKGNNFRLQCQVCPKQISANGKSRMDEEAETQYEYSIREGSKGLFVIIANTDFGPRSHALNYGPDVDKIYGLFNLEKTDENVIEGRNLTNGHLDRFTDFMASVQRSFINNNYSFLMFFLMSHGNDKNCFQLANSECDEDCDEQHTMQDQCQFVNYYDCIINILGKIKVGVPKLFFMQVCRGGRHATNQCYQAMPNRGPVPASYNADDARQEHSSDMLVMFPCVQGHPSFVSGEDGSHLIKALVHASEKVKLRIPIGEKLLEKLTGPANKRKGDSVILPPSPIICLESLADGWLENIFTMLSEPLSRSLKVHYREGQATNFETIQHYLQSLVSFRVEKCQPECINTLKYKLSWIKILRTQEALKIHSKPPRGITTFFQALRDLKL